MKMSTKSGLTVHELQEQNISYIGFDNVPDCMMFIRTNRNTGIECSVNDCTYFGVGNGVYHYTDVIQSLSISYTLRNNPTFCNADLARVLHALLSKDGHLTISIPTP